MFIQAFRFAYEPFIFARARERGEDSRRSYADAMKYFVLFAMVIFLGVMYYLDILRHFISEAYFSGLKVVPVVMIAEFFFGVFYNLSVWYKVTDRTQWGTWFSLTGLGVTVALNLLLVPLMGYMGCAIAAVCCYGVMMVASYIVGQRFYPIDYRPMRLVGYFLLAMAFYAAGLLTAIPGHEWITMAIRTPMLLLYIFIIFRLEGITPRTLLGRN